MGKIGKTAEMAPAPNNAPREPNTPPRSIEAARKRYSTPMAAIRHHCVKCCGENPKEVTFCQVPDCPLFPFRFGKRPGTAKGLGLIVDPEEFRPAV